MSRTPWDHARIAGFTPASAAFYLKHLEAQNVAGGITCVAPDDDTAQALADALAAVGLAAFHFPDWDPALTSGAAPSIKIRHERIAALAATLHTENPIVVLSVAAWLGFTLSRERLAQRVFTLQAQTEIASREGLLEQLSHSGYLRVETVEDPGTFCVRGDLIDLFVPGEKRPVRVELFDTLVERLRPFDIETQRALKDREIHGPWRVIPAKEALLFHADSHAHIRDIVKAACDERGITRDLREPYVASLLAGAALEPWLPWINTSASATVRVADVLPETLVVWDPVSCEAAYATWVSQQVTSLDQRDKLLPTLESWKPLFENSPDALTAGRWKNAALTFVGAVDDATLTDGTTNRHVIDTLEALRQKQAVANAEGLTAWSAVLRGYLEQAQRVLAYAATESQIQKMRWVIQEHHPDALTRIAWTVAPMPSGFFWPERKTLVLTEREFFPKRGPYRRGSSQKTWSGMQQFSDLRAGDLVVHRDHGIGRYLGLTRMARDGGETDFLTLEYAERNKLYLPVVRLNLLQKYLGGTDASVLDRLGSPLFQKTKERVREALRKMAFDLVELYAKRKLQEGRRVVLDPHDTSAQAFENAFGFEETPDQSKAIDAVLEDLASGRVMDRLICGDVGFGKTEVAMRAAFAAVNAGLQVAVLVPTTVLAFQHEQTFRTRFKDTAVSIDSLSRFKSPKESKAALQKLAEGKLDILVGTHRMLSRDVVFKNLGLVIVDEEHRFGVEHKEKLKTLRINTHVLTLTATPIPRTLHLSLNGLRDISLMNTPPVDRLPIRTTVSPWDAEMIRSAAQLELSRGGQIFFVHNRVQSLPDIERKLREILPHLTLAVAHGQMPEGQLEAAMLRFYRKEAQLLLCTSIIESGLDIPNANTIFLHQADHLGLAQLYQLRGRVGRSQNRGYCYCFVERPDRLSDDAKRRLEVIQRFVELGSGFQIASHDLEIRGGGNLLGAEQSGHIAAVGFEMYTELLEEAVAEIQRRGSLPDESASPAMREPDLQCPYPALLPESYVPDVQGRLSLYRRLSLAATAEDLEALREELIDRFGPPPQEALELFSLLTIKNLLKRHRVPALSVGADRIALTLDAESQIDPTRLLKWAKQARAEFVRAAKGDRLVIPVQHRSCNDLARILQDLFSAAVANPPSR